MFLWDEKGIPHKGWVCVGMEDLGRHLEEMDVQSRKIHYEQCQKCNNEGIRYVHIMEHPEYHTHLRVGQQCAEKMEEDYTSAKRRENNMMNRNKRLQSFHKKEWNLRSNGNFTLKYKGYDFTIKKSQYNKSSYGVYFLGMSKWEYKGDKKLTLEKAKLLAFDLLEGALQRAGL